MSDVVACPSISDDLLFCNDAAAVVRLWLSDWRRPTG
jgi:hypothetical protein